MKQRLRDHGRNHRPGGTDPLYPEGEDAIRFNINNVGEWLSIETTGPASPYGILLNDSAGSVHIYSDDGAGGGEIFLASPFIRFDTSNGSLRILDSGETFFEAFNASWTFDDSFALQADTYNLDTDGNAAINCLGNYEENVTGTFANITEGSYSVNANDVNLTAAVGGIVFGLANTGTALIVSDHSGNPIFKIEEDGDVFIKTGKTITASL